MKSLFEILDRIDKSYSEQKERAVWECFCAKNRLNELENEIKVKKIEALKASGFSEILSERQQNYFVKKENIR